MEETGKLKRSEQGALTKKNLTRSALKLFSERGYNNVSIADICTAVGVTVGVFYHYFTTKSDVFKDLSLQTNEKMKAYQVRGNDAIERIEGVLHRYGELTAEIGRDTMTVIATPSNGLIYTNNYAAKLTRRLLDEGKEAGEINEILDTDIQLDLILSVVWGTVLKWCAVKETFSLIHALDKKMKALLESFRKT